MKKLIVLAIAMATAFAYVPEAQAQGFMKKVAKGAKGALGGAFGNAFGVQSNDNAQKNTATPTTTTTTTENSDEYTSDGEEQLSYASLFIDRYHGMQYPDITDDEIVATRVFNSLEDILETIKEVPEGKLLSTEEGRDEYLTKLEGLEKSFYNYIVGNVTTIPGLNQKLVDEAQKGHNNAGGNAKMQEMMSKISPNEVMQVLMNSGLDLENATEEQMQEVLIPFIAKKMGMSESQLRAQANMEAVTGSDKYDDRLDQLLDEMDKIATEERNKIVSDVQTGGKTKDIQELYDAAVKAWDESKERQEIDNLEDALDSRVGKWLEETNYKNDDTRPEWWTQCRKQQNAIVDAYNVKAGEQWGPKVQEVIATLYPTIDRIIAINNEVNDIEKKGGNPIPIRNVRAFIGTAINGIFAECFSLMHYYTALPVCEHTPEVFTYIP